MKLWLWNVQPRRGSNRFERGLPMSWKIALQRSHKLSVVLLKRSRTISVWAKLSLCPMPSLVSTPFKAHSSGKISWSKPLLSNKSKPRDGFGDNTILFNSSTIRSLEMMEIRSRLRIIASNVSGSIKKPNWEAKRTARIIRSGSSLKVTSGSSGVRIVRSSISSNPPKGSTSSP